MMSAAELRELPDDELRQQLEDHKQELFNLRFQNVTGQLDNPRRIKTVKRQVARVLTVMREREIALARQAAEESEETEKVGDAAGEGEE